MTISKELQEKINAACKAHLFRSKKETFQAGVEFVLSPDILKEVIGEAMEWADKRYFNDNANFDTWFSRETGMPHTSQELVSLYFTPKQQEG